MASHELKMRELLDGREVFAWWPVRIYTGHCGFFRDGWAWMRPVIRTRRLGHYDHVFHILPERKEPPLMQVDMNGRLAVPKSAMPRLLRHYRKQIEAAGRLAEYLRRKRPR